MSGPDANLIGIYGAEKQDLRGSAAIGRGRGGVTKWTQREEFVVSRLDGDLYSKDLPDLARWRDNHFNQLPAWDSFRSRQGQA